MEIAHFLLKYGTDMAAKDKFSWTPLHYSYIDGHVEVAHVLIRNHMLATAKDKIGCILLHVASFRGYAEPVCVPLM